LADVARCFDRPIDIGKRGLRIAEQPKCQGSIAQTRHARVHAEPCGQRAMGSRVVKGDRPVEMHSAGRNLAAKQRGNSRDSVRGHSLGDSVLLLREREKLFGELACPVAVERREKSQPDPVQGGKRQERIVGSLAERLYLLNQQPCLVGGRPGFRRGEPLDVFGEG
jgi:hypothetical protein